MNDTEISHSIASLGTNLGSFLPVLQVLCGIVGLFMFFGGWLSLVNHRHHGAMMRHSMASGDNVRIGFVAMVIGVLLLTAPEFIAMLAASSGLDPRSDVFGAPTVSSGDLIQSAKGFADVVMTIVGVVAIMHGLGILNKASHGSSHDISFKSGAAFILGGVAAIHYEQVVHAIVLSIDLPAFTNMYNLVFGG